MRELARRRRASVRIRRLAADLQQTVDAARLKRAPPAGAALDEMIVAEHALERLRVLFDRLGAESPELFERVDTLLHRPDSPLFAPTKRGALRAAIREILDSYARR